MAVLGGAEHPLGLNPASRHTLSRRLIAIRMSERTGVVGMAEVHIQLFGGEQDGYRTNIDLRGDTPEMFFIWRAVDNEQIATASGKTRVRLADRLAVLAYRLTGDEPKSGVPGERELRYVRCSEADKKLTDPAL